MLKLIEKHGHFHDVTIRHLEHAFSEWKGMNSNFIITRCNLAETVTHVTEEDLNEVDDMEVGEDDESDDGKLYLHYSATLLIEYETPETLYVPLGNGLYVHRAFIMSAKQHDDGTLIVGCGNYAEQVQPNHHVTILQMVGAIR